MTEKVVKSELLTHSHTHSAFIHRLEILAKVLYIKHIGLKKKETTQGRAHGPITKELSIIPQMTIRTSLSVDSD